MEKTSYILRNFLQSLSREYVTIDEIINILGNRSLSFLLIVFSLVNLIPIPGLSTIIGIPLIIFSSQIILGHNKPWLPKAILEKNVKSENLKKVISKSLPYLEKIEKISKPRMLLLSDKKGNSILGVFQLIFAIILTLPIVFANALPSLGIIFISIGMSLKDGLIILAGIVLGFAGSSIAFLIVFFGWEAIEFFISKLL